MKIVIKKKYLLSILVILLQFVIHLSFSQIITQNEYINLQQNEQYLQDISDLYEFVAKNITFPSGYPQNQINQPYTSLSDTKNNQVASITLASFNYANAIYSIALGYQLKSNSNNLDVILTYYRTYINSKNGVIKREELNNRKIESIDPQNTPNYSYGSMFNYTAGFVSYYKINSTYFQKSVYFFNYLDKIGINLVQITNIDLFKHVSILAPNGTIYLIQYRFQQFQLYRYKNQESQLVDLTNSFKDVEISKYVADQGKYYFGISLQNSTVYCASINFSSERLIMNMYELPQFLSEESEVYVQRINDYFYIIISDIHQISILKYQSLGLLDFGTMKLIQNQQFPFGFGARAFPTFISQNNFIFIKDRQILLVDANKSRVIYSQSFDAGLDFYQLDYYQNQFILYFINNDGKGKITYLSKQIQIKAPSLIIQGKQQQFSLLISSSNFPFSFNLTITVNITTQEQVTFQQEYILITQMMDTLLKPTQYFPVEPYVEGPDLSLEVNLPQPSKQLIKSAQFVKVQSLKSFQQFKVDETFVPHQTDYYFASLAQRQKLLADKNQKALNQQQQNKSLKSELINLQIDVANAFNQSNQNILKGQSQIFYEIVALVPVQNSDGSGSIQVLENEEQFNQKIDQIDNSGSFTLQQDQSQANQRIYVPFVNLQKLILNYYDFYCNTKFMFTSDISANALFISCGSLLQMVSFIPSSDSNMPLGVTQLYNITIDPSLYNNLLTNRGLLFIYNDIYITAFDYINISYFPFAIQIPKISPNQQVLFFKHSFILISPSNSQASKLNINDITSIQAAQYSYNNFQQSQPTLLRYLQIDQYHLINSSYKAIAIRNDIEYLLLSQAQQPDLYNIYRISSSAYSQNQFYSTIQIPTNSIPIINSDMICILQNNPDSDKLQSNVNCSQIMEKASIMYDLLLDETQFYNNLSFSAQLLLSSNGQASQTYNLVLQRNAELKNMVVDQNSEVLKLLEKQFYQGGWGVSTIFSFNDQKILNTCVLGWYTSYSQCIVSNRISYSQTTQQQLFNLNSKNIRNVVTNINQQDRNEKNQIKLNKPKQTKVYIQKYIHRILQENNYEQNQSQIENNELSHIQIQYFNTNNLKHENQTKEKKYENKEENYYQNLQSQKDGLSNKKQIENKQEEQSESGKQFTVFSFLFDQSIVVSQSLTNIMNFLSINQDYYGCSIMDDNSSITNRKQGVFQVDLYVLCPQYLDKYNLNISRNSNNQYTSVKINSNLTYSTQYIYDMSPFWKLLSINQDIILTKFNGDKYFLKISDNQFYIDQNKIPYSTMIGINAVSTLSSFMLLTFFENQILYVQVVLSQGILNQYIDISDLLEDNQFSIASSDTINSVDQYSDTKFRIAFSNSYIYDAEVQLNNDGTTSLKNVSLYYYKDAFSKHISGFKGSKYHLFYGFKDNQYILTLYSNANSKQNQYLIESKLDLPFNTDIQGIRCAQEISPSSILFSFSNQQVLTFDISDSVKFTVKSPEPQIPSQGVQLQPINQLDDLNIITLVLQKKPPQPPPFSSSNRLVFSFAYICIIIIISLLTL
ncbi:hypothetical protein ABPG72_017522 [Tetrahymena utriculariae]